MGATPRYFKAAASAAISSLKAAATGAPFQISAICEPPFSYRKSFAAAPFVGAAACFVSTAYFCSSQKRRMLEGFSTRWISRPFSRTSRVGACRTPYCFARAGSRSTTTVS